MATLTYLANSGAFFAGGLGLGYFLHDIRTAIKNREVKIVVTREELEDNEEKQDGED